MIVIVKQTNKWTKEMKNLKADKQKNLSKLVLSIENNWKNNDTPLNNTFYKFELDYVKLFVYKYFGYATVEPILDDVIADTFEYFIKNQEEVKVRYRNIRVHTLLCTIAKNAVITRLKKKKSKKHFDCEGNYLKTEISEINENNITDPYEKEYNFDKCLDIIKNVKNYIIKNYSEDLYNIMFDKYYNKMKLKDITKKYNNIDKFKIVNDLYKMKNDLKYLGIKHFEENLEQYA